MTNIRTNSNAILGILVALALAALVAVEYEKIWVKRSWYDEKLAAARLAKKAADYIKEYRFQRGIFTDIVNDPNETALIGQEHSLVTTGKGDIDAKLSTTNPNYAAVVVELLKQAGVSENDNVAVSLTGSFPGLNIAVYAALDVLRLNGHVITSAGSSSWGATDPYFTWLDIERLLNEAKIFRIRSFAASIGGGADRGVGLSPEGRSLIAEAIKRNGVEFINEDHLEQSIERRLELYDRQRADKPIAAFINIGGGIASLGSTLNDELIPQGLTMVLPMKNYPMRGVIIRLAQRGVPIIHLSNPQQLERDFGLPSNPIPLPEPGSGEIFQREQYNTKLTLIATAVLVAAVTLAIYLEKRRHRLGTDVIAAGNGDEL